MQTNTCGRSLTDRGWRIAGRWVLGLGAAMLLTAHAQDDFRPDRILVQLKSGVSSGQVEVFHASLGVRVLRHFPAYENLQVLGLSAGTDVRAALQAYQASGLVELAEPDFLLHTTLTPDDPYFLSGALWYLHNTGQSGGVTDADMDAPEAWDSPVSASNIIVAIVDTGVRYTHQDLAANMWRNPTEIPDNGADDDGNGYVDDVYGINAAAGTGDPADLAGHGTTVAGVAGAAGNNGLGTATASWHARLMACRFYDDAGVGSSSDAITCIDYARQKGAHIINASWVSTNYSSTLYSVIRNCQSAGIVVVAGAGNDGFDNDGVPYYPASYDLDNIVAVAATTRTDALANYSNYGATSVDVGAPGSEIVTTSNADDAAYATVYGTSYCAPLASSVLALVKARYPSDSYLQILNRVYAAVDPLPSLAGKCVTGGRINLANAIGPSLLADFDAAPISGSMPLTVNFTDKSFGTITNWSWTFGDGGVSSARSPSHTYSSEGTFTATLTILNDLGQSSSKTTNIAVVANYQITNAPYAWLDPAGLTALSLSNDGVSPAQSLPFDFRFYGLDYTQLYVGANGLIGLANANLASAANTDLPNTATPNNVLCPFWDDLNPEAGGSVLIGTTGTAPNRKVVVSWVNVPYSGNPPASFTFQALLEEGTHRILFQYQSVVSGHGPASAGQSATVGVENAAGTVAARYSYDGSTPLANGTAILFIPPLAATPAGVLTVSPTAGWTASGLAGGPFTPSSTTYTLTNPGGSSLNWTATSESGWVSLSPVSGTLAPGASAAVTVSLNSAANSLTAGSYTNLVSFINTSTGNGNTTRPVSLTVNAKASDLTIPPPWRWSNPLPHGANIVDQAANSAMTVQVGERGQIYLSDDWNVWTPRDSYTTAALRGATFFGGRLVITGEAGTVMFADDPWNFYGLTLGTDDWLESVAASSSLLVAVGDNAAVYTSTNAVSWLRVTPPFNNGLRGVACNGSMFVTVGEGGLIASSPTGNGWQVRDSGTFANLNRVAWLGDHFLAVGDGGGALSSTNGTQWDPVSLGVTNHLYAAAGVTNSHLAAGDLEALLSENNGLWSSQLAPTLDAPAPAWTYFSALWNTDRYLLAGRTGMAVEGVRTNSAEPVKWRPLAESVRTWLWSVARTPTHYVAVGDRGTILSSPNGIDWDLELVPFTATNSVLLGVGGSSNLLLAVGSQGTVLWGTNVFLWNELAPKPTTHDLQGVCHDGGQFILSGGNGTILTSPDGTNWTQRTTPTTAFLMCVTTYPGGLITVGEDGVILTSADGGTNWVPRSSGTTNWLSQVRWANDRLLAVGENGTILNSADGANWRTNGSGTTAWLNAVDFFEDTWFIVGNQGTVLGSPDATNWFGFGTLTRKSLYSVTIHEGQMLTVGSEGVILRSQLLPDPTPIQIAEFDRASGMNAFLFTGAADQQFRLQSSPDLRTWTDGPLLEFLDSSGTLIYVEDTGTNAPGERFYRARRE